MLPPEGAAPPWGGPAAARLGCGPPRCARFACLLPPKGAAPPWERPGGGAAILLEGGGPALHVLCVCCALRGLRACYLRQRGGPVAWSRSKKTRESC
ncbi:MAG: hypothetical protein E2599_07890 [Klebsiella sp.]|nr:hypothetical protein [Klebsiella sp.]